MEPLMKARFYNPMHTTDDTTASKRYLSQCTGTEPAFFNTLSNKTINTLKAPSVLLNDPNQFSQTRNVIEKRMKSLPQIKSPSKTLYVKPQNGGMGRLYKGIFTPHMGRVLGVLTKKRHEIAPQKQEAFITERSIEETHSFNITAKRHESVKRSRKICDDLHSLQKANKSSLRTATEKLLDDVMDNGSHSLRMHLKKFAETGDRVHLFFCDFCPHCRVRSGDYYSVKKRIEQAREVDEYFFDFFDLNQRLKTLKEFQEYADTQDTLKEDERELLYQFLTKLIDEKISIQDLVDPVNFAAQ